MTLRHIIVEGPDGSGKTGMVARITETYGFIRHARASDSRTGPNPDLTGWTLDDLEVLENNPPEYAGPWVYDRHPLISERIYATTARRTTPQGKFADMKWVADQRERLAPHALLLVCLPPRSHVHANVRRNAADQMPGVVEYIDDIYNAYRHIQAAWPGITAWWDYTYMDWGVFQHTLRDMLNNTEVTA